jgi:hypothetical protein
MLKAMGLGEREIPDCLVLTLALPFNLGDLREFGSIYPALTFLLYKMGI